MRAIVIHEHGGPEVLQTAELPVPEPSRGEALVRVKAVSVNSFLDISNRMGQVAFARYSFPHVLGSEHAGEVAAFGPGADSELSAAEAVRRATWDGALLDRMWAYLTRDDPEPDPAA